MIACVVFMLIELISIYVDLKQWALLGNIKYLIYFADNIC